MGTEKDEGSEDRRRMGKRDRRVIRRVEASVMSIGSNYSRVRFVFVVIQRALYLIYMISS